MFSQPITTVLQSRRAFWWMAALAVALRLLCAISPGNYDYESYELVRALLRRGEPVYLATERYNYAPFWMGFLWLLKDVPIEFFRFGIVLPLALIDVGIAALLRRLASPIAALFFLFNPWSVFISGHHHQFDNAAILVGLLAVAYMARSTGSTDTGPGQLTLRQTAVAAAIIGLSLVVKHVFYLFPLWMVFRVQSPIKRAVWLLLPPSIFLVSFLPFWSSQGAGIVAHVFNYSSRYNAPLLNAIGPAIFDTLTGCETHSRVERAVMHCALLATGIVLRRRSPLELMAVYCTVLVTFAAGTFNHYFAIPVIFLALYPNRWSALYTALAIPFYSLSRDAFAFGNYLPQAVQPFVQSLNTLGHIAFVCTLGAALVSHLQPRWEISIFFWIRNRITSAMAGRAYLSEPE